MRPDVHDQQPEPRVARAHRRPILVVAGALLAAGIVVASPGQSRAAATVDGEAAATGPISAGATVTLKVTGRGGVPASNVGAVALNVTATNPTAASYLTVWPTGAKQPTASNLNVGPGQTTPNMVIAPVGTGGHISLYNDAGGVDVIVDVLGWFPTGGDYHGLTPARLMDTRPGNPTIDHHAQGGGALAAGVKAGLTVTGRGGLPASNVGAVALNVTVTNPTANSYLTVWPTGTKRPTASNLNYTPGQTIPNMVIAPVGTGGHISLYNDAGTADVIVDVLGWFPTGGDYHGLTPARLMDTRPGSRTIDHQAQGAGVLGPAGHVDLTVTGRGGLPASNVGAVALNVTVTNPTANSYLTVWPTGTKRPTASNLNYTPGQTIPNMVIAPVGTGGRISLYNDAGSADVIVDVLGWFSSGGGYHGLTPARFMDTRLPAALPGAAIGPNRNLLVVRPDLHQMSGNDRIAVWSCDVPPDSTSFDYGYDAHRFTVDVTAVAAWAQSSVAPYFDKVSRGRYETTFVGVGHIALTATESRFDCLHHAVALTDRPFTNVFVTDNADPGGGYGGSGSMGPSVSNFSDPPASTGRGFWVGGGSSVGEPNPFVLAHEIGHTLHWPHSFYGPGDEYDDPTDLMSQAPPNGECTDGSFNWPCRPQNTLAFNRFAAGWIDDDQVRIQTGGTTNLTLAPPSTNGLQMVVAPDPGDAHAMLTFEARPLIGYDQYLDHEGVAAYIVDQRLIECGQTSFSTYYGACIDTLRRQSPAVGGRYTAGTILTVGSTTVIDGVTIKVLAKAGTGFTVQVSGTFHAPAELPHGDTVG